MTDRAPDFVHDPQAGAEAYALGGQLAWEPVAAHLAALTADVVAPDGDCARCALKCCAYVISVPEVEVPGVALAAARLGFGAHAAFRVASPQDEPATRTLARRDDGRCLFYDSAGRCRIHAVAGAAAKPTVCQLFPGQPIVTPAGDARLGVRSECPWPQVTRDADAVARYHAALTSRASAPPGLLVRVAPALIRLDEAVSVPFAAFDAWVDAAMTHVSAADTALAGLDLATADLIARFDLTPPAPDPLAARILAAALAGVLEASRAEGAAAAFMQLACGAPPLTPRPTPRALVAAALGSLEPLRWRTVLAGLGALRLFVAAGDRDERARVAPNEVFAGYFRQLHQDLVRLPLARAAVGTLDRVALDPTL